jgi:pilus assembly protein CpaE
MAIQTPNMVGTLRSTPVNVCCLSPNRSLVDELTPALMRCLPGAAMRDIRYYPHRDALPSELSGFDPQVCFLDVASDRKRGLALITEFLALRPNTFVVVLLAGNEPEVILKSLRLGASEFLLRPFTTEQLEAALSKLTAQQGGADAGCGGMVYCVTPVKGGCGASTIAINLADQWMRSGAKPVLLADMDPLTGTLSFLLKLKSRYSFIDVLQHAETLDGDLWGAMIARKKGLDVLLAPEELMEGIGEIQDASPIINYARRNYRTTVIDAASAYGAWNLSIARGADVVLLATTNELPALMAAQRALAYLEMHQVDRSKLRVVLNRYNPEIGLTRELVSSALHITDIQTIGSDYEVVQQAVIDTKPIPPGTRLGKDLAALAAALQAPEAAAANQSGGGLLGMFSRR